MAATKLSQQVKKIASKSLHVSEPDPRMFGNDRNPSNNPDWSNANWLKSRFHFSFAEYYNPRNTHFGPLRVMNDDLVQPDRGFGEHPHRNAEICTYVVDGFLSHADSMGTAETLPRGSVQFITAGRGVTHSERNLDKKKPLRFIQMWFTTRQQNLPPNYGSSVGDFKARHNQWAHLVTDVNNPSKDAPIKINADVNLFTTELDTGRSLSFDVAQGRQAYVLCVEGSATFVDAQGQQVLQLDQYDAAEVVGPLALTMSHTSSSSSSPSSAPSVPSSSASASDSVPSAGAPSASPAPESVPPLHVLIVEMAASGGGRTDL